MDHQIRAIYGILDVPLMPKRRTSIPFLLPARPRASTAIGWLYDALRTEILSGRLGPGSRVPSTRDLATTHGLSRGTVVAAFEQLAAEGYIEGSVGSGTYVAKTLPDERLEATPGAEAAQVRIARGGVRFSRFARHVDEFPGLRPG